MAHGEHGIAKEHTSHWGEEVGKKKEKGQNARVSLSLTPGKLQGYELGQGRDVWGGPCPALLVFCVLAPCSGDRGRCLKPTFRTKLNFPLLFVGGIVEVAWNQCLNP